MKILEVETKTRLLTNYHHEKKRFREGEINLLPIKLDLDGHKHRK